ncbi:MAG: hypothetical protein AAFO94_07165, partial [Bacteroidota bacterium]
MKRILLFVIVLLGFALDSFAQGEPIIDIEKSPVCWDSSGVQIQLMSVTAYVLGRDVHINMGLEAFDNLTGKARKVTPITGTLSAGYCSNQDTVSNQNLINFLDTTTLTVNVDSVLVDLIINDTASYNRLDTLIAFFQNDFTVSDTASIGRLDTLINYFESQLTVIDTANANRLDTLIAFFQNDFTVIDTASNNRLDTLISQFKENTDTSYLITTLCIFDQFTDDYISTVNAYYQIIADQITDTKYFTLSGNLTTIPAGQYAATCINKELMVNNEDLINYYDSTTLRVAVDSVVVNFEVADTIIVRPSVDTAYISTTVCAFSQINDAYVATLNAVYTIHQGSIIETNYYNLTGGVVAVPASNYISSCKNEPIEVIDSTTFNYLDTGTILVKNEVLQNFLDTTTIFVDNPVLLNYLDTANLQVSDTTLLSLLRDSLGKDWELLPVKSCASYNSTLIGAMQILPDNLVKIKTDFTSDGETIDVAFVDLGAGQRHIFITNTDSVVIDYSKFPTGTYRPVIWFSLAKSGFTFSLSLSQLSMEDGSIVQQPGNELDFTRNVFTQSETVAQEFCIYNSDGERLGCYNQFGVDVPIQTCFVLDPEDVVLSGPPLEGQDIINALDSIYVDFQYLTDYLDTATLMVKNEQLQNQLDTITIDVRDTDLFNLLDTATLSIDNSELIDFLDTTTLIVDN